MGCCQHARGGIGTRGFLLWVVAGAFCLRLGLVLLRKVIEEDGAYYASLASALLRGDLAHGLSTAWPPLYPALIAAATLPLRWVGGSADPASVEFSARLVSTVAGTALLVGLYFLGRALLPERFARIAVILAAVHPRLLEYSAAALTESTYSFLVVSALAATYRRGSGLLAGALFGLAFLARPEGLFVACAIGGIGILRRQWSSGRCRMQSVALLVGFFIIAGPYLLFLRDRLGTWSVGEKGEYNFWRAYRDEYASLYAAPEDLARRVNESPELSDRIPPQHAHVGAFVLRRPDVVANRSVRHVSTILLSTLPLTVYAPFALLALVAIIAPRWRKSGEPPGLERGGGSWLPVVVTVAVVIALYAPISVDRRFFVPTVPLVLLGAARGLQALEVGLARQGKARVAVTRWLVGGLFVFSLGYAMTRAIPRDPPIEHREAGRWLARYGVISGRAGVLDPPIVVSRKPWVAYYAGALIMPLRNAPLPEVLAEVRERGGDYLVADQRSARADRPALDPLLDQELAPAGLTAVHTIEAPRKLALYRISK